MKANERTRKKCDAKDKACNQETAPICRRAVDEQRRQQERATSHQDGGCRKLRRLKNGNKEKKARNNAKRCIAICLALAKGRQLTKKSACHCPRHQLKIIPGHVGRQHI